MSGKPIIVTLPDGKQLEMPEGSTAYSVAESIGPGLAKSAIAAILDPNGEAQVIDLYAPLAGDCTLSLLTSTDEDPRSLSLLRHSTAHVMAEAICKLYPGTKLAYGPPLDDGFYYDIDCPKPIAPDDFKAIEEEMQRIVSEDRKFTRYDLDRAEAMAKLEQEGNRFKVDNAERAEGDTLSFYVTGENRGKDFEDLCRGPHIPSTKRISAFKVRQVSGSYYRGDVNEQQLQRVYGTAFFKKKSLRVWEQQLEEAKKRDHRMLGKELDLFTISPDAGSGLVLWEPNGAIVRMMLENFIKAELIIRGYQPVFTPHIGRLDMYRTSGHYPYYEDSQFPALYETDRGRMLLCLRNLIRRAQEEHAGPRRDEAISKVRNFGSAVQAVFDDLGELDLNADPEKQLEVVEEALKFEEGYLLKPMNCPHHIHIYKASPHSYRDLPVRLAEFGTVYRYEQSGELGGMVRVRGFTQDDAHIFCTAEQLPNELRDTIELTQLVLSTLEFKDYRIRMGTRDPDSDKYTGDPELWDRAEQDLRDVIKEMGIEATEEQGEAAFYGPKIDFVVKDCIGREWQLGTVQVDYNLPNRFDISYVGTDNTDHRPVMIHRAPFGSMERFVGILIEHFAGAFPLWLAPVQVAVATISEKSIAYGQKVYDQLAKQGIRAILDSGSDKIGPKKHRLRAQKIPYIVVVGENEAAEETVNINDRDGSTMGSYPLDSFVEWCFIEIQTKGKSRHKSLTAPERSQ
ncbi:MAG: threonine--tRNA ligase [Phycisphaerae bacterium]|nr:MAG: threonine--tRNA ligase [Phycisphaerae bacterium]